jgi:hypothetical protein
MFLIRKGEKPVPICRECGKIHSRSACPKRPRRLSRGSCDDWSWRRYNDLMDLQESMQEVRVG